MRRPLCIATFVLVLALSPALAQHGGGHGVAGGGHVGSASHGSFGGGHVGGGHAFSGSGGHSYSGAYSGMRSGRGFSGRGLSQRPSFRQPSFHQPYSRANRIGGNRFADNRFSSNSFRTDRFRGDRDGRFHSFGFRNCFGWNCGWGRGGWPWWYAGYYDPWLDSWWWDSGSPYDQDRADEIEAANEMNQQSLDEQRASREEDQDLYARSDARPPAAERTETQRTEAPTPATVLVFRDQHKQEVQNYAIVGQTLWAFSGSRTQKIPLADLDIAATSKANDDRGVTFRVPTGGEASRPRASDDVTTRSST